MPIVFALWAVAIALATAAMSAAQVKLPSEEFWAGRSAVLWVSILILSGFSVHSVAARYARSRPSEAFHDREKNVRAVLSAALSSTAECLGVDWKEVGVHAFRAAGAGPFLRLVHVGGLRLGAKPSMSRPLWRPGKGVVGAAFVSQKVVAEDWQSVYRAGNGDGPEKWMARPRSERYDLSWGELQLTAEYAGIVACPVFHPGNGKIIGCVAVTAPTTRRRLVERSMLTILRNLAHSVALLEVSR